MLSGSWIASEQRHLLLMTYIFLREEPPGFSGGTKRHRSLKSSPTRTHLPFWTLHTESNEFEPEKEIKIENPTNLQFLPSLKSKTTAS
jgi:hypothetical protein